MVCSKNIKYFTIWNILFIYLFIWHSFLFLYFLEFFENEHVRVGQKGMDLFSSVINCE